MSILFVGPFPPPVHGASNVTAAAAQLLRRQGLDLEISDVSPVGNGARYHMTRLYRFMNVWRKLAFLPKGQKIYLSLSGSKGLFYDCITCVIAAFKTAHLVMHHHSYAYISRKNALMSFIVKVTGPRQKHIFLSPSMSLAFRAVYGEVENVVTSNLVFFNHEGRPHGPIGPLRTLGYLSNITFEKGIGRFINLMEQLQAAGSDLRARIAGPIADPAVKDHFEAALVRLGNIEYVGPVYGEQKTEFLASIDYFIFPSLYANEAQPLVIYEAQLAGLPVSLTDRGSLKDMAGADDWVLDADASQLPGLVKHLLHLNAHTEQFFKVRERCLARRNELLTNSVSELSNFLSYFE